MPTDISPARRKALIEESETIDRELRWIGILADQLGQQDYYEFLPDIVQGLGEYIRKYTRHRIALEAYFLGRSLLDSEPDVETQATWSRLQVLYPDVHPVIDKAAELPKPVRPKG